MSGAAGLWKLFGDQAERYSGIGLKVFGFIAESAFTITPESCSGSSWNSVRNHPEMVFTFDRIRVSTELIERVRSGSWNPENHEADRRNRDALAARGYWQAFQLVKANVGEILAGANPSALVRASHRDWYRELFQPCVAAGHN